ncbi:MerR HTH family regulatory protein [Chitinophaga ginsengisegetis]|uniref:MerR HTH family regulatory protein n=1 Tax=Chitinophaga ginsengisegetis TaxID=393003 RepID=A0A1T5PB46_9BACT|nr:chaperone modulator CbpM [Chitinophaga ginsengisegetis]SKD09941.1 MerR HTH family regulatory protein [Chitinophaga ginsengisegetis]
MDTSKNISVAQCCTYYKIETTFVQSLNDYGLITLTQTEEEYFIDYDQLADLERFVHLHYDMDINLEGIEAITHLLNRVHDLQHEVKQLRRELGHGK